MPSLPSDRPRFTTFETWNHQPGLWIVTVLSIVYAALVLAIRPIIRRKFTKTDATLYVGYGLGAISYGLMFAALEAGAGKAPGRLSADSYDAASKLVYATIIFLLLACGCSACSQLCQLEEIVPGRTDKWFCWASITLCSCSTVVSSVVVSAGCPSTQALDSSPAQCTAPIARWSAATALMMINFLVPSLLPLLLFRKLHTALKRKLGIYTAFAFPLANLPVLAVALSLYMRFTTYGSDSTGIVDFLCCLEVLLGWALICPTIPIGRPIALRFATGGTLILSEYGSNFTDGIGGTISEPKSHRKASVTNEHDHELCPDRIMNSHEARRRSVGATNEADGEAEVNGIRKTVTTEVETVDTAQVVRG